MAYFFFMTTYEQPLSPSEVKIPENCQGNLNKPLRGLTYDGNRAKLLLYWTLFPTWMHFLTHIIILLFHAQKIGVRKQN